MRYHTAVKHTRYPSLNPGKYQGQIDQALADNGIREVDNGRSVLFFCQGGNSGVIQFVKDYGVGLCVDAGAGNSDHCE
ncbi:hypothetical protein M413DRAFT_149604 [Hebeloma cylindrosporum]|uniref:Uncharacterized protein n=1 Tax=Hebeloma cylindrosporum TaxID=76867 RepID=A0A0C3BY34_HEBCY|nr:hypothetical protein M413DRAFT_149604 [Hebeloma cylindrosporum h7]